MRIYVPGVLKRIQVNAIPVLAQVLVFYMTRIQAGHVLYHFKWIAFRIRSPDCKTVHVMYQRSLAETDELLCVGQRIHRHRENTAGIVSCLDLSADIGTLPFIPVRNVWELGLPGVRTQFPEFRHGPAFTACLAEKAGPFRSHSEFRSAGRALIQDLVESFSPFCIGRPDTAFFLPGEIIVLECFNNTPVDF